MTDEEGYADRMNSIPKFVASTTLADATWNATVISDVTADVPKLKRQYDLLVMGSGRLVRALRETQSCRRVRNLDPSDPSRRGEAAVRGDRGNDPAHAERDEDHREGDHGLDLRRRTSSSSAERHDKDPIVRPG